MYTEKRKYYPKFPKSLQETVTQLTKNQNENSLLCKSEKCIHVPDNQLFSVYIMFNYNTKYGIDDYFLT